MIRSFFLFLNAKTFSLFHYLIVLAVVPQGVGVFCDHACFDSASSSIPYPGVKSCRFCIICFFYLLVDVCAKLLENVFYLSFLFIYFTATE